MATRLFGQSGRVLSSDARLRRLSAAAATPPIDGRNSFFSGQLYLGQTNIGIGLNALACAVASTYNVGIGENALYNVTSSGTYNVAIGYHALEACTAGTENVAIGSTALHALTVRSGNIAIGLSALAAATDAGNNIAIGATSLQSHTSGDNNVAVGVDALGNNLTGSGNVAIGFGAGQNELGSNKLYVSNSNTATPLIYGEFDTPLLKVYGSFQVTVAITAPYFVSNVAIGTAPFQCTSTTLNTNLNADMLDGSHATAFAITGHDLLGSKEHADTLTGTVVQGDTIVGNATPKWSRLAANATATNKFLRSVSGGVPSWEVPLSFGTTTQIPYMNAGGTDFLYSANMTFDGTTFTFPKALATDKLAFTQTDGNEYIDSLADGYLDLCATTSIRFRNATADTDVLLECVGTSNSGQLYWMEDEDYFRFVDCLKTEGGRKINVTTVTTTYAVVGTDELVVCNSTSAFTVSLPAAAGSGRKLAIKNINTGTVTVDGNSSDTIDGSATLNLIQWEAVQLVDSAANKWSVI